MANPSTREELKQWCLRKLGKPVIEINVDDTQLEDRIDEGLSKFFEYHHDGTQRDYLRHIITQDDIDNKYITIADSILYVTRLFSVGSSTRNPFSASYQLQYSAFSSLSDFVYMGGNMSNYVMQQQNISLMQQLLASAKIMEFHRHMNRIYLYCDMDEVFAVGDYVVFEIYRKIDPTTYSDVYNDSWLKKYITSLFKQQWGNNISKFVGVNLLDGLQLDGQRILADATAEITALEEEILDKYSLPPMFTVG